MKLMPSLHWSEEKEVISSNKAIKLLFMLFSYIPAKAVIILIYPVSFFYLLFSKRARKSCNDYQKQLRLYTGGSSPVHISAYRQILSFSLCVLEKIEGWMGKIHYNKIIRHDDDIQDLIDRINEGKGAYIIGSHLGNLELLRALSSFGRTGTGRKVCVTAIMEMKSTEQFNKTMIEINPNCGFNVIQPSEITPETIINMQEHIENGGLVVAAADRTSSAARTRCIKMPFLGRQADFPYGVFLMAMLLNAPVYFVFGLRTKTVSLNSEYNMFAEQTKLNLNCSRRERENRINELCFEFVAKLEKYCIMFPYQWYNFYDFWAASESSL